MTPRPFDQRHAAQALARATGIDRSMCAGVLLSMSRVAVATHPLA
jgi:hypothetical protein